MANSFCDGRDISESSTTFVLSIEYKNFSIYILFMFLRSKIDYKQKSILVIFRTNQ